MVVAMEYMFVTNVVGLFQTHTQVPNTDVHTRGSVVPLKVTSCLTWKAALIQMLLMKTISLMKITTPPVRTYFLSSYLFIYFFSTMLCVDT